MESLVQENTVFLGEVRDFIKERSALEKEYSGKLETLVKTWQKKRTRREGKEGSQDELYVNERKYGQRVIGKGF